MRNGVASIRVTTAAADLLIGTFRATTCGDDDPAQN
jgi:hypothetical protein